MRRTKKPSSGVTITCAPLPHKHKKKISGTKFIEPIHILTIIINEFTMKHINVYAKNNTQMILQYDDMQRIVNIAQMYEPIMFTFKQFPTYVIPWTFSNQSLKKERFIGDSWAHAHETFQNLLYAYNHFFIKYACLVGDVKIIMYRFFIRLIQPKIMMHTTLDESHVDCKKLMTTGSCSSKKCEYKHPDMNFPTEIVFFNVDIMDGDNLRKTIILSTKDCKNMSTQNGYSWIPLRENNAHRIAYDVNLHWSFPDSNYYGIPFSYALDQIRELLAKYYLIFIVKLPYFFSTKIRVIIYEIFISLWKSGRCQIRQ